MSLLFVIKKFYAYDSGYSQIANGLKTSAKFVVDMLRLEGYKAKLVEAIDGNSIDALVTKYKPSICILEAIWVTPAKMAELKKLHPKIRFVVRVHSELPFLSNEGMAVEWLTEYNKLGIEIAFNSAITVRDFEVICPSAWLPNYYPVRKPGKVVKNSPELDIGCFGAIRPLKNQLLQCFAAIKYAKWKGKKLYFHINSTRTEQGGDNNLKSIKAALAATGNVLVEHPWMDHEDFLEIVQQMDICLQVSLSESFNIVSADAISMGVPLIGSVAIRWLPKRSQAPVDNAYDIAKTMLLADNTNVIMNHAALTTFLEESVDAWVAFLGD